MAGGEGTRLRPLTSNTAKPMLPMANKPMMEHIIGLLRRHGFDDIVVTVAFMANSIRSYFGDGSEFGVKMSYATEQSPLGTAGSVLNAAERLSDERFLVISGDVLTDIDLTKAVAYHDERGSLATLALKAVDNPLEFGLVITREDGSIDKFLEKPSWGQVFSDTINTGVYVLEPEVFGYIEADRPVDFAGEVFPAILETGKPIYGYPTDGYWEDVGTIDAYLKAHEDILSGHAQVDMEGFSLRSGVWIGKGAEIDPAAKIQGPAIIGANCRIGAGAVVGPYCTLGANVRLRDNVVVEHSVVHDRTYVGQSSHVEGSVVGRSCDLRQRARLESGAVMGEGCFVGSDAVLRSGVKIYPFKTVEQNAIVNSSIVWETRGARNLFGPGGLTGLANVDINPELVTRIFMAWAGTFEKGARLTASRDTSRAARVLKRAAMVGCNAAGVDVDDLEVATVPVTRFMTRSAANEGGFTVRLSEVDPSYVTIRFFDRYGNDLDESAQRKIERLYFREDFRRLPGPEFGDLTYVSRTLEQYVESLMNTVDAGAIVSAGFKMVLDYSFGTASFVMPNLLSKLQADVLVANPFGATASAASTDRWGSLSRVAELVKASGADLGAVIDPGAERLSLVGGDGSILDDFEAALVMMRLIIDAEPHSRFMLPLIAPIAAQEMCAAAGAGIVWGRVFAEDPDPVRGANDLVMASDMSGGYAFCRFLPAYDASASLINLLSLLASSGRSLTDVLAGIPEVHIVHEEIVTSSEHKGSLMRTLIEEAQAGNRSGEVILVEGVKIPEDGGWTLVLPDPAQALTHVWTEARSLAEARARAESYAVRINDLAR